MNRSKHTNFATLIAMALFALTAATHAAVITDTSNNDGGIVSVIDGDTTGDEIDSAAVNATGLATVNANLDYVISNWGSQTWDDDTNTLQNVGGLLDVTIAENFDGNRGYDPDNALSGRSITGTSSITTDFRDDEQATITFSADVDAAGFVISNLGGAYDASGSPPGLITVTFRDALLNALSTQTWSDGGTDGNAGDAGQADAYFGYVAATTPIRSILIDIQRDDNSGNGGTGLDDLGFGLASDPIPEPASAALLGLAGLALLRRRRAG